LLISSVLLQSIRCVGDDSLRAGHRLLPPHDGRLVGESSPGRQIIAFLAIFWNPLERKI
jgi:hypothetical protein